MTLIIYCIKLSACLMLVYLFYRFLLHNLTFFNYNRFFFLTFTLLSFFIPLLNVGQHIITDRIKIFPPVFPVESAKEYGYNVLPVFKQGAGTDPFPILFVTEIIISIGMLVFSIRLLSAYISYRKIRSRAILISDDFIKVYHLDEHIIPFSFGTSVFINKTLYSKEQIKNILNHETVHVRQKHSIDIVFSEILCAINWYNPFAWLLKKAIRQNLEFVADRMVLRNCSDKKSYQYLLVQQSFRNQQNQLTSQFNFSSVRVRVLMMNKKKSKKVNLFKYLLALPMITLILMSFRNAVIPKIPIKASLDKYLHQVRPVTIDIPNSYEKRTATVSMSNKTALLRNKISDNESQSAKGSPPPGFIYISAKSTSSEIHNFMKLLKENKYVVTIDNEIFDGGKLDELSGVLGGEPFQESLTGPLYFRITNANSSVLGFNRVSGKLYSYNISTETTNN